MGIKYQSLIPLGIEVWARVERNNVVCLMTPIVLATVQKVHSSGDGVNVSLMIPAEGDCTVEKNTMARHGLKSERSPLARITGKDT